MLLPPLVCSRVSLILPLGGLPRYNTPKPSLWSASQLWRGCVLAEDPSEASCCSYDEHKLFWLLPSSRVLSFCLSLPVSPTRYFSLCSFIHTSGPLPAPVPATHTVLCRLFLPCVACLCSYFWSQLISHLLWEALPDHSPSHRIFPLMFLFHCIPLLCGAWSSYKFRMVCDYLINVCFSQEGRGCICFCSQFYLWCQHLAHDENSININCLRAWARSGSLTGSISSSCLWGAKRSFWL